MKTFQVTSSTELASIVEEKKESKLEVTDNITGFNKDLPNSDFSMPREVPPTSSIHNSELAAQVISGADKDQKGKYIRLVTLVYFKGGRIFYKKIGPSKYEMHIQWS